MIDKPKKWFKNTFKLLLFNCNYIFQIMFIQRKLDQFTIINNVTANKDIIFVDIKILSAPLSLFSGFNVFAINTTEWLAGTLTCPSSTWVLFSIKKKKNK